MDLSDHYQTLRVAADGPICTIQMFRPGADNTICPRLIDEMHQALDRAAAAQHTIVVLKGSPEVFCFGADFELIREQGTAALELDPERLFSLWEKLADGPYVSVAHVQGKANAGGLGFVAACNIALADEAARFSLSELLFGLIPACVMPFLVRRVGLQRANYLTLLTQPITAAQALGYGLVDACDGNAESLLRRHLLPLRRLSRRSISAYKAYLGRLAPLTAEIRQAAVETNRAVFNDPHNLRAIETYVRSGVFPWETEVAHGR